MYTFQYKIQDGTWARLASDLSERCIIAVTRMLKDMNQTDLRWRVIRDDDGRIMRLELDEQGLTILA